MIALVLDLPPVERDTGTAHGVHEGGVQDGGHHDPAFDAGAASRWIAASAQTFEVNRSAIDAINVFPVADSDTGTNLLHTLRGCARACASLPAGAELATVLDTAAGAAVTAARGNSGMIVSQLLRGVADELRDADPVGPLQLATALVAAARSATAAVADPAEGTMLSVLRAAATAAATAAARGGELTSVGAAARDAAETALDRTPDELDVLARAGVVDAGGHGIVLLLAELTAAVGGARERVTREGGGGHVPAAGQAPGHGEERHYGYEVMYRLDLACEDANRDAVPALRAALGSIGDCVSVVSDGSGNWRVHVHCDDIGAAVEAGIAVGTPGEIAVTSLPGGTDDRRDPVGREFAPGFTAARAVVAVVAGERLARLFRAEGALVVEAADVVVEADGAATGTGPETVYAAIRASRAAAVTVVPQWQELLGVCTRAAELAEAESAGERTAERVGGPQRRVVVVPAAMLTST